MNDETILQRAQPPDKDKIKRRAALVFARAPVVGHVKTRLIGARCDARVLDARAATTLYAAMLRDTLELARHAASCELFVAHTPANAFTSTKYSLRNFWDGARFPQGGGKLGTRLLRAFQGARNRGHQKIVVLGSDAPDLPPAFLQAAFESLENHEDHDLVFGPARDGGFYLIGAAREIPASLFRGVTWSTSSVLRQTVGNAARLKMSTHQLAAWRDVDDEADLSALIERLKKSDAAPHTRRVLESWSAL